VEICGIHYYAGFVSRFRPNGPRYHSPGRSPGYAPQTSLEAPTGRAIRLSAARWAFRLGILRHSQGYALGYALGYDSAAPWA